MAARTARSPCGRPVAPPSHYDHVVLIVMENHAYDQIVGSSAAPYLNAVARQCGLATDDHAMAHPSLPNYIALTSGSTQGVSDDNDPSSHLLHAASIFSQVGDWRALEESMPAPCARTDSGEYAVRHNPPAYYTTLASCARDDVPLGRVPDLSARFTFITPNLIHDMHDGSVQQGDAWLSTFLPEVFATPEYRSGRTAVFVTWDEDDSGHDNHVATFLIAPWVHAGTRCAQRFTHLSLLRTIEDGLGVPPLSGAASAASMRAACTI